MVFVVNMKVKESSQVVKQQEVLSNNSDFAKEQAEESIPPQNDETRFMPKAIDEEENELLSTFDKEEPKESMPQIILEVDEKPAYRFCRYCGKKIDYEGVKYCKHCGKPLD
jgi:RNA polymerase-binding transcription factor DksA